MLLLLLSVFTLNTLEEPTSDEEEVVVLGRGAGSAGIGGRDRGGSVDRGGGGDAVDNEGRLAIKDSIPCRGGSCPSVDIAVRPLTSSSETSRAGRVSGEREYG